MRTHHESWYAVKSVGATQPLIGRNDGYGITLRYKTGNDVTLSDKLAYLLVSTRFCDSQNLSLPPIPQQVRLP